MTLSSETDRVQRRRSLTLGPDPADDGELEGEAREKPGRDYQSG